jgi:hypothetical protein
MSHLAVTPPTSPAPSLLNQPTRTRSRSLRRRTRRRRLVSRAQSSIPTGPPHTWVGYRGTTALLHENGDSSSPASLWGKSERGSGRTGEPVLYSLEPNSLNPRLWALLNTMCSTLAMNCHLVAMILAWKCWCFDDTHIRCVCGLCHPLASSTSVLTTHGPTAVAVLRQSQAACSSCVLPLSQNEGGLEPFQSSRPTRVVEGFS